MGYRFFKDCAYAAAKSKGLGCVRLGKKKSELIAADTEGRVRGAKGFLQRGGGSAQDLISARMTVLVIDFLEAMQIQNNKAERLAVAARAIQFLLEGFTKETPIVETCERISDSIQLKLFQFVVFDENRNPEKVRGGQNIHKRGFQRSWPPEMIAKFAAAQEHVIPELQTLRFTKIEVGDGAEKPLQKLSARRSIQAFERIS